MNIDIWGGDVAGVRLRRTWRVDNEISFGVYQNTARPMGRVFSVKIRVIYIHPI